MIFLQKTLHDAFRFDLIDPSIRASQTNPGNLKGNITVCIHLGEEAANTFSVRLIKSNSDYFKSCCVLKPHSNYYVEEYVC